MPHVRHTAAEKRNHLMAHGAHFQRLDVLVDAHGVDGRGKAQIGLGVARHERGRPLDEILARQMVKCRMRLEVVRTEDQVTGGAVGNVARTAVPLAFSSAMLAAVAWAVGHTPQMRCTIWAASRG